MDLDGTLTEWDAPEDDAPDDWDAEPQPAAAVPEPEPEARTEPAVTDDAPQRRQKKGKNRFKQLLAERDAEGVTENLDAYFVGAAPRRPKEEAEAERQEKSAKKKEAARLIRIKQEAARVAAEKEPESWDDEEEKEELDSWDQDEGETAVDSGDHTVLQAKLVYGKAQLLSFRDNQPTDVEVPALPTRQLRV